MMHSLRILDTWYCQQYNKYWKCCHQDATMCHSIVVLHMPLPTVQQLNDEDNGHLLHYASMPKTVY